MGIWQRTAFDIRRRFIAGIITIIPISITAFVFYFIIKKIYQVFGPVVGTIEYVDYPVINKVIPVFISVVLAFSLIYLIGLLSAMFTVRRLIMYGENILARIPIIKILYLTSKQIIDTVALPQKTALKKVVAVEYPRHGIYGLAFLTGEMRDSATGKILVTIFLPTTPNPTSGFLLLLPHDQVYEVNLTIDEGIKFIISGGILNPEKFEMTPYKSSLVFNTETKLEGE